MAVSRERPESGAAETSRAAKVADAWKTFGVKNHKGRFIYESSYGTVEISDLVYGTDGTVTWVDVYIGGNKKPSFRVCNPPTQVEDPRGSLERTVDTPGEGTRTMRFEDDPVRAIASAVIDVRRGR